MSVKESEEFLKMSDGFSLFARRWSPNVKAEKTLVCIHGLGGHSGGFIGIGRSLAAFGIEVWGLDLRGFGNSKEPDLPRGDTRDFKRHLQDLNEAVNLIRASSQSQKLFMLGHSLGGLYVLWYAAKFPDSSEGLIIAAPAIEVKQKMTQQDREKFPFLVANAPETMIESTNASKLKALENSSLKNQPLLKLFTVTFSARYFAGVGMVLMRDKVFLNAAEVKKPTLILQGDMDEEALPTGAKRLFESLAVTDKKLELVPGARHALHGAIFSYFHGEDDPEKKELVFSAVKDWLKAH